MPISPDAPSRIDIFVKTLSGKTIQIHIRPELYFYVIEYMLNYCGECGGPPGWTTYLHHGKIKYGYTKISDFITKKYETIEMTGKMIPVKSIMNTWIRNYETLAVKELQRLNMLDPCSKDYPIKLWNPKKSTDKNVNQSYPRKARQRALYLELLGFRMIDIIGDCPIEIWREIIMPKCISFAVNENGKLSKHSDCYD